MGNHRADRRAPSRPRSERRQEPYVGRRVAHHSTADTQRAVEQTAPAPVAPAPVAPAAPLLTDSTPAGPRPAVPGKRRAVKHAGRRGPLFRGLPSMPVVVGVATLAVSVGGVLTSNSADLVDHSSAERLTAPNAASGSIGTGSYDALGRSPVVSRDSDRDALDDASSAELVEEVEAQAEERNARLGQLAQQAEVEAREISLNRWVLPIDAGGYNLSAEFGQAGGYWSSGYHTGLDFAAPSGTPIRAVANGTVTSVGYDGAYGNKTVITLEDGTEIWFCHQTSYEVVEGQTVTVGQVIGYVGSTGNSTGPHLHLEVRPGGGDPVDPFAALVVNGAAP